jgi:hypothetical protein
VLVALLLLKLQVTMVVLLNMELLLLAVVKVVQGLLVKH